MPTNINATKVCKYLYICAILYYLFYLIKKKLQYFMILLHMYSTKFSKAANFCTHRCGSGARLFSHLVQFSKRGLILILSNTHFRYYCNVISLQLINLKFDILCKITPHPILPITVFICLSTFKIQILPQIFVLSENAENIENLGNIIMVSEILIFTLGVENLQFNSDQCNKTNSCKKGVTRHMDIAISK